MPVVSPAAFERLLRSLDEAALAAFVADLWAARGWETTVEGATVLARDPDRDRQVTIRCEAARRGWRSPGRPDAGDADVIVRADRSGSAPGDDGMADARVLGPGALRERLLYALDRDAAARLFAEHFDRPLAVEPAGPGLRDRVRAATPRDALAGGVLVLLVLGLALAASGGPVGLVGEGQPGAAAQTTATAAGTPTSSGVFYEPPPAGGGLFRYPPGIGPSGVTDAAALAAAHREAVDDRRWDLLLVHRGSADLLDEDRRWVGSRQTVDRLNASRYWYRVTGLERLGGDSFRSIVYDDYADGQVNFRRVAGTPAPTYHRTRLPAADGTGVFAAASAAYVHRYLDTTASRVEFVDAGPTDRYRVVATGTPRHILLPVSNYTAVAVVGRDGLVHRLTVEFVRLDRRHAPAPTATPPAASSPVLAGQVPPGTVRFRLVFRDLGDATVGVPAWYDAARNATNGTEPGPWPNDPAA